MSRKVIRLIALVMSLVFSLSLLSGCPTSILREDDDEETEISETTPEPVIKVGISMPTRNLPRWDWDGSNLKASLEEAGYEADLQFAQDEIALQITQIENMITDGCEVLVVASIDGSSLSNILRTAKDEGVTVISYDRLIRNTDAIDYYITFDNYLVGTLQGKYIEKTLDLINAGSNVYNIELFAGAPDDYSADDFYQGAYDVLSQYIDAGTLNVVSGQIDFEEIATEAWKTEFAQTRMDDLLTAYYDDDEALDAVLSPNDSLALGIANSLTAAGFEAGVDFPVITGQDCDRENIKNIIKGKQSMSVFKDTRELVRGVVEMVDAIVRGNSVPINDTKTFDNGAKVIPTLLCESTVVDANNYREKLIDPGYYTEEDLKVTPESSDGQLSGELSILTFTNEIKVHTLAFMKENPDVQINLEVVSTYDYNYYDKLTTYTSSSSGPDVVTLEFDFIKEFVEKEDMLSDLSVLGPKAEEIGMYPYTLDIGTDAMSGELRALSYQFTPMMVYYRRSLAKQYFGTDDPVKIQALLQDMDGFTQAAQTVHDKSSGKTYMIASYQDLERVFLGDRSEPWVVNDKLNIDPKMEEYMMTAKMFVDNGYAFAEGQWRSTWFDGIGDNLIDQNGLPLQVFCYILPTWGLTYLIQAFGENTEGDWGAVPGPVRNAWGGTWLGIPENARNKELAEEFISFVTLNEKALTDWATGEYTWEYLSAIDPVMAGSEYDDSPLQQIAGDLISSAKVAEEIQGLFENSGLSDYLGGQNFYEAFCEAADRDINGKLVHPYDSDILYEFGEVVQQYVNGVKDKDAALQKFRDEVKKTYGI